MQYLYMLIWPINDSVYIECSDYPHIHWDPPFLSPRAPSNSSTVIHLLPMPHHSRAEGVRLRWSQEAPQGPEGYESCWGMDNVLLVNAAHKAPLMEDNLDPPDTANWLFFPGATIKVCWHVDFLQPSHYISNWPMPNDRVLTPVFLLASTPVSLRAMLCISMVVRALATASPPPETLICTGKREGATGRKTLRACHQSKSRWWSCLTH